MKHIEPKQQRARAKKKGRDEFFWMVGPPHFFNPGDAADKCNYTSREILVVRIQ